MSINVNFIAPHRAIGGLRKTYSVEKSRCSTYPKASKLTSTTEAFDPSNEGLEKFAEALRAHGRKGEALLRGVLKKPLVNESRVGLVDKIKPTRHLVIDVDGLELEGWSVPTLATEYDVQSAAERVMKFLPSYMHDVSYVAEASSSFGLKGNRISLHLHFFLETEVSVTYLKMWLKSLNYTNEYINSKLEPTPTGQGLKSIIDPCCADNSRIIYIAPPVFDGIHDPFNGHSEKRVAFVCKGKPLFPLMNVAGNLNQRTLSSMVQAQWRKVCKELGIESKARKTKEVVVAAGQTASVVSNPDHVFMEFARESEDYVQYNVNGGDSNAYYVAKNNPEVVYCFKPDEQPFLFKAACPEMYDWHIEQFGGAKIERVLASGKKIDFMPIIGIDKRSNRVWKVDYNRTDDVILDINITDRTNGLDYLMQYGLPEPDFIKTYTVDLRPHDTRQVDEAECFINRFRPTSYMRDTELLDTDDIEYGFFGTLTYFCPQIFAIIYHMVGSDDQTFEHFMNWLAYAFQTRDKCKTAWLFHGVEGTGKGIFFRQIIRPLFGAHAMQQTLQRVAEDSHNGWVEEKLFVMIDEFNANDTQNVTKTMNILKNLVTEETVAMRAMNKDTIEIPNFMNLIFATNDIGALALSDGQRRFHVAPRQEVMLKDVYPTIDSQPEWWDEQIAEEIPMFAKFLRSAKTDVGKVRLIVKNEFEQAAKIAGKNAIERFFHALRIGDIEWFIDQVFLDPAQLLASEVQKRPGVQMTVKRWIEHIENGGSMYIPVNDFRGIYSFLSGKDLNQNAFSRMLTKAGVETARVRDIYNAPKLSSKREVAMRVTWKFDQEAIDDVRIQLNMVKNVTPITGADDESEGQTKKAQ